MNMASRRLLNVETTAKEAKLGFPKENAIKWTKISLNARHGRILGLDSLHGRVILVSIAAILVSIAAAVFHKRSKLLLLFLYFDPYKHKLTEDTPSFPLFLAVNAVAATNEHCKEEQTVLRCAPGDQCVSKRIVLHHIVAMLFQDVIHHTIKIFFPPTNERHSATGLGRSSSPSDTKRYKDTH